MPFRFNSVQWGKVLFGTFLTMSLVINIILFLNWLHTVILMGHCVAKIEIFEEAKRYALEADNPGGIRSRYEYVKDYYPSGTIQTPGSRLDFITETARQNALDRIQARLEELEKK